MESAPQRVLPQGALSLWITHIHIFIVIFEFMFLTRQILNPLVTDA